MARTIRIVIMPDGRVQAEVQGIKGKACTNYVKIIEELLDAEVIDSAYTPEYHEGNVIETENTSSNQNRTGY